MPVPVEPAIPLSGAILDWYDTIYPELPYTVPASSLATGLPEHDVPPRVLRRFMLSKNTSYATRDQAWAGIITLTRHADTATAYTLIALGIALKPLRWYRHHLHLRSAADIADLDADLVEGVLIRLPNIDIERRNIAGRLIRSAKGYAARRYTHHRGRPQPADLDTITRPWQPRPGNPDEALHRIAARLTHAGPPFEAGDIELIGRTRLDGQTLIVAAGEAGLSLDAAYKRRQRAEARIASLYPQRMPPCTTAAPSDTEANSG